MALQFTLTFIILYVLVIVHAVEGGLFTSDSAFTFNVMGVLKVGATISAICWVWGL